MGERRARQWNLPGDAKRKNTCRKERERLIKGKDEWSKRKSEREGVSESGGERIRRRERKREREREWE